MQTKFQINVLNPITGNVIIHNLPHADGKTSFKKTMYVNNQHEIGNFSIELLPVEDNLEAKYVYDQLKEWQRIEIFRLGGELEAGRRRSSKPALQFYGSGEYVTIPSSTPIEISNSFAIEVDFYIEDKNGTYQTIFDKGASGETEATNSNYNIFVDQFLNFGIFWETGSGVDHQHLPNYQLQPKRWYKAIASYDHISQYVSIYINGERIYHASETYAPVANNSPVSVGIKSDLTTYPFNGTISNIKLYDRYIDLYEASELMFDRYSLTDLNLWLKFMEGQGAKTYDMINNLEGTISGANWTTAQEPAVILSDEPVFTGFIKSLPSTVNRWTVSGIDALGRLRNRMCLPIEEAFSGEVSDIIKRCLKARKIGIKERPLTSDNWVLSGSGTAIDTVNGGIKLPIRNKAYGLKTATYT